jgi:integrase
VGKKGGQKKGACAVAELLNVEQAIVEKVRTAVKSICIGEGLWLMVRKDKKNRLRKWWAYCYPNLRGERYERHTRKEGIRGEIKTHECVLGGAEATLKSVRDALAEADQCRNWVRQRIDPISQRKEFKKDAGYKIRDAIKTYDKRWLSAPQKDEHADANRRAHRTANKRWVKHIETKIGNVHPSLCTAPFLLEKLEPEKISGGSRGTFWTQLRAVLNTALFECGAPPSPDAIIKSIKSQMPKEDRIVISHGEKRIPHSQLWKLVKGLRADKDERGWANLPERPISSYLAEFALQVGVRISEVCDATWEQMYEPHSQRLYELAPDNDQSYGIWVVPKGSPNKKRFRKDVPITPEMMEILNKVRELLKDRGFSTEGKHPVFANPVNGKKYSRVAPWRHIDKVCDANDLPHITLHSWRTNIEGYGEWTPIKKHHPDWAGLIQIQIGHVPPGAVKQAYSHEHDQWPERCKMASYYARHVTEPPPDNTNVTNLDLKKAI